MFIVKKVNMLTIFLFSVLCVISCDAPAQDEIKYPSGDAELDSIRLEVRQIPTTRETFQLRAFKMKLWMVSLQQQGARLDPYLPIDNGLREIVWWNTIRRNEGKPQAFTDNQMKKLTSLVDKGYAVLDSIQKEMITNPPGRSFSSDQNPIDASIQPEIPWTHYKGNEGLTGYTGAIGPQKGINAWKFPIGLAWESQPKIQDGKVYLSSPGMRTVMYSLDLQTGEEIWSSKQLPEIMGDQLYNTPSNQSTPVILKDRILYRELGARGNKGPTKEIVHVNKQTGKIEKQVNAGHVDYRAGYAPFDANETYTVFTNGTQDIHENPPVAQGFHQLIVQETKTGKQRWKYNIGFSFAEPLLDSDNQIFVGTKTGYMYAFDAGTYYGGHSKAEWEFRAGGSINEKAEVYGDYLLFGANDGTIYCLDKNTGELIWKYQVEEIETRAFRHFSRPFAKNGKVIIGGANKMVYAFDISSGELLFDYEVDDYVRARPVFEGDRYFFATMKGTFYGVELANGNTRLVFKKDLSSHPILADLTIENNLLVINDSDLYAYCLNTKGEKIWEKSLIESFEKEGTRILNEPIAGGAYYQSKPTAVNGMVFVGAPNRFVYAVDAQTGEEIWKSELSAAISGAPTYANGKIYIGQQGGGEDFYSLDAQTGEKIWTQKTGWVWGSANFSDGMAYVPGIDGYVNALDGQTGNIVWRHRFGMSVPSEPAVEDDQVIFGGWFYYLKAFDKKTGHVNWQFQGGGTDSGVGIIENGIIYVKNKAIDAQTGELLWEFDDGDLTFNITPAYYEGKVYTSAWHGLGLGGIPTKAVLYCLDAKTGEVIWKHPGGGLTSPVIDKEGNVYFPSTADPYFYSVDAEGDGDGTTSRNWVYKMSNRVEESTPALYKGKAYILASDGYLHAIK